MNNDQAFIAAVLGDPEDDSQLLLYADWLEQRGDNRHHYIRNQLRYRTDSSSEVRKHLIDQYPHEHLSWTGLFEQAGVFAANLTPFKSWWWGTGIEPARKSGGTYERYEYRDQPPLQVERFDGSLQWLLGNEPERTYDFAAEWSAFCADTRQKGYHVPELFERFMTDSKLPGQIKSCTGNCFKKPDPEEVIVMEDGLFITFYADSQYCILWGILFPNEPGRYAPIISGDPASLYPDIWNDEEDLEDEEDRYEPGEPAWVAPHLEAFLYRYWIENEIWYATLWEDAKRDLTEEEQAYLDALNGVYRKA